MRPHFSIVPYEPMHRAMLPVRPEQVDDLRRFGQDVSLAANLGPAFSVVEKDGEGRIVAVLACGGLAVHNPDYATAWAAFAGGLRPAQWSPVVHAVRAVIEDAPHARIDTLVRADWPVGRRFVEALGFKEECVMYSRSGGGSAAAGGA